MDQERLARISKSLRKVPGLPWLLDLRLAILQRWRGRRALPSGPLLLNVGAGPGSLEGWLNADLVAAPAADALRMDATKRWPFDDGSAVAVNSEHFLEHISPEDAAAYFSEAFRVLKPGAPIRTSTPDLEGISRAYLAADPLDLEVHREFGYSARNHAEMLNNYFYSWEHRHIYDFDSIAALLAEAGFEGITRAQFGQSEHPVLQGIDTHEQGRLASLVVALDAVKPA